MPFNHVQEAAGAVRRRPAVAGGDFRVDAGFLVQRQFGHGSGGKERIHEGLGRRGNRVMEVDLAEGRLRIPVILDRNDDVGAIGPVADLGVDPGSLAVRLSSAPPGAGSRTAALQTLRAVSRFASSAAGVSPVSRVRCLNASQAPAVSGGRTVPPSFAAGRRKAPKCGPLPEHGPWRATAISWIVRFRSRQDAVAVRVIFSKRFRQGQQRLERFCILG